jgi:hypothetical protein
MMFPWDTVKTGPGYVESTLDTVICRTNEPAGGNRRSKEVSTQNMHSGCGPRRLATKAEAGASPMVRSVKHC